MTTSHVAASSVSFALGAVVASFVQHKNRQPTSAARFGIGTVKDDLAGAWLCVAAQFAPRYGWAFLRVLVWTPCQWSAGLLASKDGSMHQYTKPQCVELLIAQVKVAVR